MYLQPRVNQSMPHFTYSYTLLICAMCIPTEAYAFFFTQYALLENPRYAYT